TVAETGLPVQTEWWVNLTSGSVSRGTGATIGLSEPDGSYTYTVATANKSYAVSPASGQLTILAGHGTDVVVAFHSVTYPVTFVESGLRAGTEWWVSTAAASSPHSGAVALTMSLVNGSYAYSVTTTGSGPAVRRRGVCGRRCPDHRHGHPGSMDVCGLLHRAGRARRRRLVGHSERHAAQFEGPGDHVHGAER
ncbi:thermopsin precursor, partial [mine drainage metagenome]